MSKLSVDQKTITQFFQDKHADFLIPGVCQIFCVNPFLVVETFGRFVGSKHLAGR